MTTASFHCGRTKGALGLSLSAISCSTKELRSLGECSPSSSSQSKPARPRISVVIGLASEAQQPISFLPASRSCLKRLGKAEKGVAWFMIFLALADKTGALVVEVPAGDQELHGRRVVARPQSHVLVGLMGLFDFGHVDLDTQAGLFRDADQAALDLQRLLGQAL